MAENQAKRSQTHSPRMATRRLQRKCMSTALSGAARRQSNVLFFEGECPAAPNRETLDDILRAWKGDYRTLERNHTYIQWLFPIEQRGVNPHAQPLQAHEAETIRSSRRLSARFLEGYKLMLDFYGIVLVDEEAGIVARAQHWRPRLQNLVNRPHNFLRVTRILKCLRLVGREHYIPPLLGHFVDLLEQPDSRPLARYASSLIDFWIPTMEDSAQREQLLARARAAASGGAPAVRRSESGPAGAGWAQAQRPVRLQRSATAGGEAHDPRGWPRPDTRGEWAHDVSAPGELSDDCIDTTPSVSSDEGDD